MPERNDVVLQTTKNVARKTTPRIPEAEFDRAGAWRHLSTPAAPDPDSWLGELAQIKGVLEHTGTLAEVADKYDHLLRLIEFDTIDELDVTDLLAALLIQRILRDKLAIDEQRLIAAARRRKATWARIAPALEVRSRQSAERRYLQLRRDLDDLVEGPHATTEHDTNRPMTQSERVEAARAHRDRRAEQAWALAHHSDIVDLARRLAAIDDLQQRADTCPRIARANQVARLQARLDERPDPPTIRTAWPARLLEAVQTEQAHVAAQEQHPVDLHDPQPAAMHPALLSPPQYTRLIAQLFSLIGYAIDGNNLALDDHSHLVTAIRTLYAEAGPNAPRAPEDYTPHTTK
ncbi:hypothetical protein G6045_19190 [Streptomyces sp. YC504]|uniref:Uncharacterized protein n=1 Tax=Streptomyces mesophilus TaxID=1775132 RepID=A0A6G4XLR3_9ACTN|nr:hypothetical protein [Streptomyces mesophilus]NGO77767.1 hypothetical protein [Streptomyces mesophilus]